MEPKHQTCFDFITAWSCTLKTSPNNDIWFVWNWHLNVTCYWRLDRYSSAVKLHCSHTMSKIHYCHCVRQYIDFFFLVEPLSLFLIGWHLIDLFSRPRRVFCFFFLKKLNGSWLNGSLPLTPHITLHCLITDFIFHLPLWSSSASWIFSPGATTFPNYDHCGDTQKRWLSGSGILAILHVSHPLAITSANKLIQCAAGKHV